MPLKTDISWFSIAVLYWVTTVLSTVPNILHLLVHLVFSTSPWDPCIVGILTLASIYGALTICQEMGSGFTWAHLILIFFWKYLFYRWRNWNIRNINNSVKVRSRRRGPAGIRTHLTTSLGLQALLFLQSLFSSCRPFLSPSPLAQAQGHVTTEKVHKHTCCFNICASCGLSFPVLFSWDF